MKPHVITYIVSIRRLSRDALVVILKISITLSSFWTKYLDVESDEATVPISWYVLILKPPFKFLLFQGFRLQRVSLIAYGQ